MIRILRRLIASCYCPCYVEVYDFVPPDFSNEAAPESAEAEGADRTFVCPPNYSSITHKEKRIEDFFKDGMRVIPKALKAMGYDVTVTIPKQYRRHFEDTKLR